MNNFPHNNSNDRALDELTKQLEEEIKKENDGSPIDLNNTSEKKSSDEILELEKDINELQETLLPEQDINPDNALPTGEEKELPSGEKKKLEKEFKKKKQEQKKLENKRKKVETKKQKLEIKKQKKQEKLALKEKKQQEKKIKKAEKALQKEIRKKEKEKTKQDKNLVFEEQKIFYEQERKENKQNKKIEKLRKEKLRDEKKASNIIKKSQPKLKFSWYLSIIQRVVIYLIAVEILIYIFSLINILNLFLLNIILPLVLILDIIVFAWLTVNVQRKHEKSFWIALRACILAGLLVGLLRGFFKFFWINEPWTVINIFIEPIVTLIFALITSLVINIFIKLKK